MLDIGELRRLGRQVGFMRRSREVTPERVAVSLISCLGSQRVETIADILRAFNELCGRHVQYKPFHNQLSKNGFALFMKAVFERLLEQVTVRVLQPLADGELKRFDDIIIQDGSSFAVHHGLEGHFRGRFRTISPAAVELHATMSVCQDQPIRVSLTPDVEGERAFLPSAGELRGKLLLADRGYHDMAYARGLDEAGAHFVMRFRQDMNPAVVGARCAGGKLRGFVGKRLQSLLGRLRNRRTDLDIEWNKAGEVTRLRLITDWNPVKHQYVLLVTNLPRDEFTPEQVQALYRLRWQVELLFKEWKSYANLHGFTTTKAAIAEGLIWAALAAALIKRYIAHAAEYVCSTFPASTRRAAMTLTTLLPRLMRAILVGRGATHRLGEAIQHLAVNARRAHPTRDATRGRLRGGLIHAALLPARLKN